MKQSLGILAVVVIIVFFIYGVYWVGKTVSYKIFYEDMVKKTVREMVKPENLK